MTKRIISIMLIILWMGFIFYNSSQSGDESNNKSYAITNEIKNSVKNKENISKENKIDSNKDSSVKKNNDKPNGEVKNNDAMGKGNKSDEKSKNSKVISEKMRKVNLFIRKSAHAFEYFVLAVLILITLSTFETKTRENIILVLFVVLFYAVGDEYHQIFVSGRTSSVVDVIIDFIGGIFGLMSYYMAKSIYTKIKLEKILNNIYVKARIYK